MSPSATVDNFVDAKASRFNKQATTASTAITYNQQKSIDFNKCWHLVRDQELLKF
jgi:hypothetical protein